MRSDGTALLMLADLIRYFSVYSLPEMTAAPDPSNDTILPGNHHLRQYTASLWMTSAVLALAGNTSAVFFYTYGNHLFCAT